MRQVVLVSATPSNWENEHAGQVVEQVVRPTGLVDPEVEVRPATSQVDDVLQEIRIRVDKQERVFITTLTKRMAEQLTDYLSENGVKVRYLHSDIDTVERRGSRRPRPGVWVIHIGPHSLGQAMPDQPHTEEQGQVIGEGVIPLDPRHLDHHVGQIVPAHAGLEGGDLVSRGHEAVLHFHSLKARHITLHGLGRLHYRLTPVSNSHP